VNQDDNYNLVAPFYDGLSNLVFGNQLLAATSYYLDRIPGTQSILVFGGGTGLLLKPLINSFPAARILFLDASEAMLSRAKQRLPKANKNVQFLLGDEHSLEGQQFDLILTPFVLDVFRPVQLTSVMKKLTQSLLPAGFWIQTDFYIDRTNPLWQRSLLYSMYLFFRVVANQRNMKLPQFDIYFGKVPLNEIDQESFCGGMVKTLLYQKS